MTSAFLGDGRLDLFRRWHGASRHEGVRVMSDMEFCKVGRGNWGWFKPASPLSVCLRKLTVDDIRFRMNSAEPGVIEPPLGAAIRQNIESIENLATSGL